MLKETFSTSNIEKILLLLEQSADSREEDCDGPFDKDGDFPSDLINDSDILALI